jgi:tetratricopeptide (TPR) repeat protein
MAQRSASPSSKTVLDLALELGIRSQTVVQTLEKMGMNALSPTDSIDPALEKSLLDQMVGEGKISSALLKGKGRRKPSQDPIADDNLITEALGASESGFNEAFIPKQVTFESSFAEKPSLLKRLFGKKQDIASALKNQDISEDELNNYFSAPMMGATQRSDSPFRESSPFQDAKPAPAQAAVASLPALEETSDEDPGDDLAFDDNFETDIDLDDEEEIIATDGEEDGAADGIDDFEVDEEILEDMEGIEVGDESLEGIEDEDLDGLEELEDLSAFAAEEESDEEISEDELDELDDELDEELEDSEEEEGDGIEDEEEEETHEPGYLERLLSRIDLSPTEIRITMAGAITTMVILLSVTVYWYLNLSPDAKEKTYKKANDYYTTAYEHYNSRLDGEPKWPQEKQAWEDAGKAFDVFIKEYRNEPLVPQAFKYMCDSYYRLAMGQRANEETKDSEATFQTVAALYKRYLDVLENLALKFVGTQDADMIFASYPDLEEQREAKFRIAEAESYMGQHQQAIDQMDSFIHTFPEKEDMETALRMKAETYQNWAKSNKELEPLLLANAIESYQEIIPMLSNEEPQKVMSIYAQMGDIRKELYDRSMANQETNEAESHLVESIAFYENAQKFGNAVFEDDLKPESIKPFRTELAAVQKKLADLYLLRGREFANKWSDYEESAQPYPEGVGPKNTLLAAAEKAKQSTTEFVEKSQAIYSDLITKQEFMDDMTYQEIHYNNAESNFILRKYPETIAAGEKLLSSTTPHRKEIEPKLNYLLGHAAWEIADKTKQYADVKKYYRRAIELDPFYPLGDDVGSISQLAEIRLTNAYYLIDKNYDKAIKRYQSAVQRYPQSDYSYLTRYYYAKALEEFGDTLMQELANRENNQAPSTETKDKSNRELQEEAIKHYKNAVDQYLTAVSVRSKSKYIDSQHEHWLIEILFNLGHSAYKSGQYKRAQQFFNDALNKYRKNSVAEPYIPQALETLADIHVLLADYGKAISIYKDYLANSYNDTNAEVSQKLAEAYLNQYDYERARDWYRRIISEYPPPTEKEVARALRLNIELEKGAGFNAMKKLAQSYHREATSYNGEKREEILGQALEAYKNLVNSYPLNSENTSIPSDPDSQLQIGNIYYELQDYENAVKNYNTFLDSVPAYPRKGIINFKIGKSYMELKQYDNAIETLSVISSQSMDNLIQYADTLILLGQAYEQRANEYDDANDQALYVRYLEKAESVFNRVSETQVANKITQAKMMKDPIETKLQLLKATSN